MTKVSEPPASKLQELLADYLSQNLKDSEDEVKHNETTVDNPDDQNNSRRHKKHKHKSKKKKKKSHHSDREDESRYSRSGRDHHRKHRHSEKDRHSGSRRHSESKDENRESKEKIFKERALLDVVTGTGTVSCKDKIKAVADDNREAVSTSTDSKTESLNVLPVHKVNVRDGPKSEEKISALQTFFRKDLTKSSASGKNISTDSKSELPNVVQRIELREEPKSVEKISPLKSFFRNSMTNWLDKGTKKLADESVVHSIVDSSENQKESKIPEKAIDCKEKVITDAKGSIRITIHNSENRDITSGNKQSITNDSKNVWRNIVPCSVRRRKRINEIANIVKENVSKNSGNVSLGNESEKLLPKCKDIENDSKENDISDSVNVRQCDASSEKWKVVDESKDAGKVSDAKAKLSLTGESFNVWHRVDLDSEKRKLTDESKSVEKAIALKEEVDVDCNDKQNYNDTSQDRNANLSENFSTGKEDVPVLAKEQPDVKMEETIVLGTNDQCKKDRQTTSEQIRHKPSKSSSSNEKSSLGPDNTKDVKSSDCLPFTTISTIEKAGTKNPDNVKQTVLDCKKEVISAAKVNRDNTDTGSIADTLILPTKTENILLGVGDNPQSDKKVSEVKSLVDNLLPDLSEKLAEPLPTVEEVQVSIINSTTAVSTESEVQCKNTDNIILPASASIVAIKGDGVPSGDVVPQATELATKPKGKIVIKDLTVCQALKNAEEERLLKLSQMEEGEVEDSAGENEAVNSGRSTPQTDEGSGLISEEEENKLIVKKKKRKRSKHKEKRKKRKLDKDQSKIERTHSSSKRDRRSKKVDGHDQKSKPRTDSLTEKGKHPSPREKILSPLRRARSRSPHHKGMSNRTRSPQHGVRSRSPLRRGRSRSPPCGGRITSPLRGFRMRDRKRSPNKQPQIFRDLREKIDKKKLLEIARKNVLQMMHDGTLPAGLNVNALKQEQVIAIKAGGKGVNELTEFCRSLVETGDDSSSDEKQLSDEDGDMPFIHHPFKLRDLQPTIRLNIRNAVQLPTKTPAEKTADAARLRLQFPVSSGSHHRNHELEWVPVEKTEESPSLRKSKEPPVLPKPVSHIDLSTHPLAQFIAPGPMSALAPPPPPPPPLPPPPPPPLPIEKIEVFPSQKSLSMDIASAMLMRVKAVQRLQENPHDMEALNQMYHAQQQMQEWAQSKLLPGQFGALGYTRMLTPEELSGPTPVWVKKATQSLTFFPNWCGSSPICMSSS